MKQTKHYARKVVFLIIIVMIAVTAYYSTLPKVTPNSVEFEPIYYQVGNEELGESISFIRNENIFQDEKYI